MGVLHLLLLSLTLVIYSVNCGVILEEDVEEQGLYSKSDKVIIITGTNFNRKIYGKPYAQVVQFYNSYCGHCRSFYPKYRTLAHELVPWSKIFRLAVIDCSHEDNNDKCREFNISAFPTLRYLHENYLKGNDKVGDGIDVTNTPEQLKSQIVSKLISEQQHGRFRMAPSLSIASYATYEEATIDVLADNKFTFFVFEDANSTIGSTIIMDASGWKQVHVKRVYHNSQLAKKAGIEHIPGLAVVGKSVSPTNITPDKHTLDSLLETIKRFLQKNYYVIPNPTLPTDQEPNVTEKPNTDLIEKSKNVYYSDLMKSVRSILQTEIYTKIISGETYQALVIFLEVLRDNFPFKGNAHFSQFLDELLTNIRSSKSWNPDDLKTLIKNLEKKYNPFGKLESDYIGCKGSQPKYRGYTCGLWTLFHTLTVGAASKPRPEGPKVLRAMHGFVKYFFGCTHCVEHFLAMAERNRLFDVKTNDRAVLWLWVSHNEVNLRLAGDVTEDPVVPKQQFPLINQCPVCRRANGAWKLPEVYQFLLTFYGSDNIQDVAVERSSDPQLSYLSRTDLGVLSFLYILSFIIIILVIKFFLTRRFYRKRSYKHGWGKV